MTLSYFRIEKIVKNIFFILFLLLISGYILIPKAFSKLKIEIGPLPVYITEIFIILSVLLLFFLIIKNKFVVKKIYLFNYFLAFFMIGLLSLSIGLYNYRDVTYILRQSSLFYYSIFYFIVFYIFDELKKIKYFIFTILICSNLLIFIFIARYFGITADIFRGLAIYMIGGGYYFPIAILLILELNFFEIVKNRFLKMLIFLNVIVLVIISIIENVRGNWIAIISALIFSFVLARNKKRFVIDIAIIVGILVFLLSVALLIMPGFFENTMNEVKSFKNLSFFNVNSDYGIESANTSWRIITWKGFIKEFTKRPVFGWGFGRKYLPDETFYFGWNTGLAENWVSTHNHAISFLYMSGIVGLISFAAIVTIFFRKSILFLRQPGSVKEKYTFIAFTGCIIYIMILGLFEVVLEIPYQGVFLWVFFAFNMVIIKKEFNGRKNEDITGT